MKDTKLPAWYCNAIRVWVEDDMKDIQRLELWDELPVNMRPKIRYWLPAAAVEETDLREEIGALYKRGFGGIEVISLIVSGAVSLKEIAAKGEGWGSKQWNTMMEVISDETGKLGMSMDITNGPGWPISTPNIKTADDPAILCELTYGNTTAPSGSRYIGNLPQGRTSHEEGVPQLIQVLAYAEKSEGILSTNSYIDLLPFVDTKDLTLDYIFPETGGSWRIFAFYQQPAIHKTNVGQYYVIDHLSEKGAESCERYWDEIFSQYQYTAMESFFCDSLEYKVSLDWTPGFPEEFQKRRGYSLLPYLPFIGLKNLYPPCDIPGYRLDDADISDLVNNDYLETLTQLYCEKHLSVLEKMAAKYHKTLRYQVAYNKPFEVERCGLYVSVPENEALGRPAIDFQKTMAAAAHLGRKERYSFECAAEFGNSYGQDYEDLFWWIKRSLMAGMNAQVLHGGSYSGGYHGKYSENGNVPGARWPGYEGFLRMVSNNWNRTLSVEDARGCMDTITRMNMIFRKQAKVDCAVYRDSYSNDGEGSEFCLYNDNGALSNNGYSYEFVSEYLLKMDVCTVQDHILDKEGVGYKCLIIPEVKNISSGLLSIINYLVSSGLPIIWVGTKPVCSRFYGEWNAEDKKKEWHKLMEQVWELDGITHADKLDMIPDILHTLGVMPEIWLDGEMDLITAARADENNNRYFILYGYNRIEYSPDSPNPDELACSAIFRKGTTKGSYTRPGSVSQRRIPVKLKGRGDIYKCNPWNGQIELQLFTYDPKTGYMTGWTDIQEDEMIIFTMLPAQTKSKAGEERLLLKYPVYFSTLELEAFEPDSIQEVSFLRSHFTDDITTISLNELRPWRLLNAELRDFSGRGTYYGVIDIEEGTEVFLPCDRNYVLSLGNVSDTFAVWVNGYPADFPDQAMKRIDITELLHNGRNTLKIVVTSNLYNRLFSKGAAKLPYLPRDYGIWESEYKKVELLVYQR